MRGVCTQAPSMLRASITSLPPMTTAAPRSGYRSDAGRSRTRRACQAWAMTRAQLDKKPADVSAMFDKVADRYDLLNDALSLGMDRHWRKVVAAAVGAAP